MKQIMSLFLFGSFLLGAPVAGAAPATAVGCRPEWKICATVGGTHLINENTDSVTFEIQGVKGGPIYLDDAVVFGRPESNELVLRYKKSSEEFVLGTMSEMNRDTFATPIRYGNLVLSPGLALEKVTRHWHFVGVGFAGAILPVPYLVTSHHFKIVLSSDRGEHYVLKGVGH